MAFRQALQLAACGLAGGSAAVLFSAVAVGKPRAGGDAEPRVVEAPAWAGSARPGPGVWDPNWDRCGGRGGRRARRSSVVGTFPRPCHSVRSDVVGSAEGQAGRARGRISLPGVAARLAVIGGAPDTPSEPRPPRLSQRVVWGKEEAGAWDSAWRAGRCEVVALRRGQRVGLACRRSAWSPSLSGALGLEEGAPIPALPDRERLGVCGGVCGRR